MKQQEPKRLPRLITDRNANFAGNLLFVLLILSQSIGICSEGAVQRLVTRGDEEMRAVHYAEARKYYQTALSYDQNDTKIILKVANAEAKMGDLDSAIKRTRAATQAEPNSIIAHQALASFLEANRDPKAAELQYERVNDLTKDREEALRCQRKAIQLLIENDDLERANSLSTVWLKNNKKSADCHFNRGLVLAQSEKPARQKEALKEFEQTLSLAPTYKNTHYQMGLLYLKLDEKEAAKQELELSLKDDSEADQLADAKDKLKRL